MQINESVMQINESDVLDVQGACKLLCVGKNVIYEGCARGKIPHRRVGRLLRFSRAALLRWLECSDQVASGAK